jgi:hypothetical protein
LATNAISLDNTAPVAPSLLLDDKGFDNTDGLSTATTVRVWGIEKGANWEYSLDKGRTWKTGGLLSNNAGSGFALSDEQTYASGSIQVRQADSVGNESKATSSPTDWTIDNTAPTVSLSSNKATLKLGQTATLTLVFSEAPPLLPAVFSEQGIVGTWAASSDKKTYTATFTPKDNVEGKAIFNLGAWYDQAGNVGSTSTSISIDVDTKPPSAPSMTLTDTGRVLDDHVTSNAVIAVGQLETGASWQYSLDAGLSWIDSTGSSFTLAEGAYARGMVQVRQTDAADNTSLTTPSNAAWLVDTTAPTTTVSTVVFSADTGTSSSDFITKTASQTISGTLSAALASGETVGVSLDGGSTWTAAAASVGQSSWSLAGQTLSGSNTLKVKVQDSAGNEATFTFAAGQVLAIRPVIIKAASTATPIIALK